MSFSFAFPHKPLLHKRIEDQWFDRSAKETHSTLTALEAAEEAYAQNLAKITTPEHPLIVLGRAQHLVRQQQQQQQPPDGHSGQPSQQQQHPPSSRRRSRMSTDTDAHTHDPADDVSTVVNPNARNRGQRGTPASHHYAEPPPAAMFWNRTRARRSAGGDR